MRVWRTVPLALVSLVLAVTSAQASVPPSPSRTLPELNTLFPSTTQLPPGMVLQETGERTEAEIAATFPDPTDAAQILHTTDWAFNAYRVYVAGIGAGPETPSRLEISLHQFSSSPGAAYALPYFVHGRAVMQGRSEMPPWEVGSSCAGVVLGDREVTSYRRIGDLLVRITAFAASGLPPDRPYFSSLSIANGTMSVMIANAGSSQQLLDQTCQ